MSLTRLTNQQVFDALDPDWWQQSQLYLGGNPFMSAALYWQDLIGEYHTFTSNGPPPLNPDGTLDPDVQANYVTALRRDATHVLTNTGCSGGITNVQPAAYNPKPIYFK